MSKCLTNPFAVFLWGLQGGWALSKKPSFQFYPGDWLKDPALRMCSPAARGVWMDLLCLLHECPQRGVFRIKKGAEMLPVSVKNISNSIAGCKPKMVQELINNGVVYTARKDDALYCKRLVKDELHRRHKAVNGKKGGSKTQANLKQSPSKGILSPQANDGSSTSTSFSTSVDYLLNLKVSYASFFNWMRSEFKIDTGKERGTFTKYAKLYAGLNSVDKDFNRRMCDKLLDMKADANGDKLLLNKMFITSINNEIKKFKVPNA